MNLFLPNSYRPYFDITSRRIFDAVSDFARRNILARILVQPFNPFGPPGTFMGDCVFQPGFGVGGPSSIGRGREAAQAVHKPGGGGRFGIRIAHHPDQLLAIPVTEFGRLFPVREADAALVARILEQQPESRLHTADQFNHSPSTKGQRPWAALRRRLDRISPDYAS